MCFLCFCVCGFLVAVFLEQFFFNYFFLKKQRKAKKRKEIKMLRVRKVINLSKLKKNKFSTPTQSNKPLNSSSSSGFNLFLTFNTLLIGSGFGIAYLREHNKLNENLSNELKFLEPIQNILRLGGLGKNIEDSNNNNNDNDNNDNNSNTTINENDKTNSSLYEHLNNPNSIIIDEKQQITEPELHSDTNTDADANANSNNENIDVNNANSNAFQELFNQSLQPVQDTHSENTHQEEIKSVNEHEREHEVVETQEGNSHVKDASHETGLESTNKSTSTSTSSSSSVDSNIAIISGDGQTQTETPIITDPFDNFRAKTLENVLSGITKDVEDRKKDLDRKLLNDLEGLSAGELRFRLYQLYTERSEQIISEGLKLQKTVIDTEAKIAQEYKELLKDQRLELNLESEKKLSEKEKELILENQKKIDELVANFESRLSDALSNQAIILTNKTQGEVEKNIQKVTKELNEDASHQFAVLRQEYSKQLLKAQEDFIGQREQIKSLRNLVSNEFGKTTVSANTHALSASVLLIENALLSGASVEKEINTLKKYSQGNNNYNKYNSNNNNLSIYFISVIYR